MKNYTKKITALLAMAMALAFCASSAFAADDWDYKLTEDKSGVIITKYKGKAANVVVPATLEDFTVKEIGGNAFGYNKNIVTVKLPNSIEKIGDGAFGDCDKMTDINLPNSLKIIGSDAFINCFQLKSVIIPESVTSIGWRAFCGCHNLSDIKFPTKGRVIIESVNTFDYTGIKTLTITKNIGWRYNGPQFYGCNKLETVIVEADVVDVPDGNGKTGRNKMEFIQSKALKEVVLKNPNTIIYNGTFYMDDNMSLKLRMKIEEQVEKSKERIAALEAKKKAAAESEKKLAEQKEKLPTAILNYVAKKKGTKEQAIEALSKEYPKDLVESVMAEQEEKGYLETDKKGVYVVTKAGKDAAGIETAGKKMGNALKNFFKE